MVDHVNKPNRSCETLMDLAARAFYYWPDLLDFAVIPHCRKIPGGACFLFLLANRSSRLATYLLDRHHRVIFFSGPHRGPCPCAWPSWFGKDFLSKRTTYRTQLIEKTTPESHCQNRPAGSWRQARQATRGACRHTQRRQPLPPQAPAAGGLPQDSANATDARRNGALCRWPCRLMVWRKYCS